MKPHRKLVCAMYLLTLATIIGVAGSDSIICSETNEICRKERIRAKPFSDHSETAPTPECLNVAFRGEDDDTSKMIITWRQKRSDIEKVTGYGIELFSYETEYYKVNINAEKIVEQESNNPYVTFQFNNLELFSPSNTIITLYSLPLYNIDESDHILQLSINDTVIGTQKKWIRQLTPACRDEFHFTVDEDSHIYYDNSGYASYDYTMNEDEKKAKNEKSIHDGFLEPTAEPIDDYDYDDSTSNDYTTIEDENKKPIPTAEPMVTMRETVLACIISVLGTILFIGLLVLLYFLCCRACTYRRKQSHHRKHSMKKLCIDRKPKIMIVTTLTDDEKSTKSYKKAALSLASTLYECVEFDIACNLWMTKQIAQKGAAIWTHSVMKSYDRIVMICNPITVGILNPTNTLSVNEQNHSDPSIHIAHSFVRNATYDSSRVIIACVDEDDHDCLADLQLPWTNSCKKFNLTCQFKQFLGAISLNGLKSCSWTSNRRMTFQRNLKTIFKQRNTSSNESKRVIGQLHIACEESPCTPTKISLLKVENSHSDVEKENYDINSNFQAHVIITNVATEVQYDSMYSSRCNSTESTSSDDDTGYHEEKIIRKRSDNKLFSGARPKV